MTMPVASKEHIHVKLNKPQESFPEGYFERVLKFARVLEQQVVGKTILCFSHAASTALVAALLKCNFEEIPADDNCRHSARSDLFAPLGIYKLTKTGNEAWKLVSNGSTNRHLSLTDPNTHPWGYNEECRQIWRNLV